MSHANAALCIAPGLLEARKCRVGGRRHGLVVMVVLLELDGRDHADLAVEPAMVEPVDVLSGRDLELVDARPGRGRPGSDVDSCQPSTRRENTSMTNAA